MPPSKQQKQATAGASNNPPVDNVDTEKSDFENKTPHKKFVSFIYKFARQFNRVFVTCIVSAQEHVAAGMF